MRFFLLLFFACWLPSLSAQFRVDVNSGNCYVRVGEGDMRYVDTTLVRKLAVYTSRDLRRSDLKKVDLRRGFSRPAKYGQDPTQPRQMIELQAATETLVETYYIVKNPTAHPGHYEWDYFQESWTTLVGEVYNDRWERSSCYVPDYNLQRVAKVLIREGDLPEGFTVDTDEAESRKTFVAALNSYAVAYDLTPLVDKEPLQLHVPFPILETMGLRYVGGIREIQPLAGR